MPEVDPLQRLEELRDSGEKIDIGDLQSVLSSSDEWWRIIFEKAGLAMAVGDPTGRVVAVSPSFQKVFGYTEQEVTDVGGVAAMTHPEDLPLDVELFGELLRGERDHYQLEKRYYRKDGGLMWGRLTVLMLRGETGASPLIVAIVQDITETKETQQAADASARASFRHEQGLELNDSIVQGLVVAKMALEGGLDDKAKESLLATLENARALVKELLGEADPAASLLRSQPRV